MPLKYHIKTEAAPNKFPAVTRSGVIAWEEGCLRCTRCVKKDCVYKVYEKRGLDSRQMVDSLDSECKDCFRCVQSCPNKLIHKGFNPTYKALGDEYWTPDIITNLWSQAEAGKIPVSGAGYGGPFSGPGFDSMWTDMSEIVRPTRDGIHGREYISTTVDLGRKVKALAFDENGATLDTPPLVELPLPVIFDMLPFSPPAQFITEAILRAAQALNTVALIDAAKWDSLYEPYLGNVMFYLGKVQDSAIAVNSVKLVEIPGGRDALARQEKLKERNPNLVVAIRLPMTASAAERAHELTLGGAEILHLVADIHGTEGNGTKTFIKDRMREVHTYLVEKGVRDLVTILGGGGVAMAEHMAKLIICGADAITCDLPLLIAMECRVCKRCAQGIACPVQLESVDPTWGAARIRNLLSGWHSQLLEILGAMGIREVRRLRGEMGRAMFREDLEKEFAVLGKRS
jgi:ferredoxin